MNFSFAAKQTIDDIIEADLDHNHNTSEYG